MDTQVAKPSDKCHRGPVPVAQISRPDLATLFARDGDASLPSSFVAHHNASADYSNAPVPRARFVFDVVRSGPVDG